LMLLAGTLSQVELSQGETYNLFALMTGGLNRDVAPTETVDSNSATLTIFTLLFWGGLAAVIIYAIVSPHYRRRILFVLLLVILAFYAVNRIILEQANGVAEEAESTAFDFGNMESASSALPEPPAFVADPPDWISWIFIGGAALLLVGVGYYIWEKRRQPDPQRLFVQEAEQALQELDAGGDLKDVVMRCYAQMEEVMRQQDVARKESMTPREFQRQLAKAGFRDEHISRLVRLFEEVRYGGQSANGRYEREARDCLSAIVTSYG
jgi:hypothetical protein